MACLLLNSNEKVSKAKKITFILVAVCEIFSYKLKNCQDRGAEEKKYVRKIDMVKLFENFLNY